MNRPSLQKTTVLSAALHLAFFMLAALVLRQSRAVMMPSPYVVNLVNPASSSGESPGARAVSREEPASRIVVKEKQTGKTMPDAKTNKDTTNDQRRIEERLTEIASRKKVERIVRLRSIISVKGSDSGSTQKPPVQGTGGPPSQGTLFDSYYANITNQIRHEWVYPDTGEGNMEAVIAVKIAKDGSVTIQNIEKSSGNALFDRSALRALAKASPVLPPPFEMEIGMRFFP